MPAQSTHLQRRYSEQDLREVLRRVQQISTENTASASVLGEGFSFSHKEVIETAKELGYSEGQAVTALVQFEEEHRLLRAERELRQIGYRRLTGHFVSLLSINSILFLTGVWDKRPLWLAVMMALWVTWLLFHLRGALFPNPDALRARARRRLLKEQLKESSREFTHSVTAGAAKLLSRAAQKLHPDE